MPNWSIFVAFLENMNFKTASTEERVKGAKVILLELACNKKWQKSYCQDNGLGIMGPLKAQNDPTLILNQFDIIFNKETWAKEYIILLRSMLWYVVILKLNSIYGH